MILIDQCYNLILIIALENIPYSQPYIIGWLSQGKEI